FSKPFSHFEEPKTIESVFQKRHKETLSLAKTRKRENPVNAAHKMASQSSTKQDEEVRTEKGTGSIVIRTEEEINTFNCDVKLSELSLAHFISFSFATKEVKDGQLGDAWFNSSDLEILSQCPNMSVEKESLSTIS
ncbi:unnamed protein product, partial [Pocillopora meandrina]